MNKDIEKINNELNNDYFFQVLNEIVNDVKKIVIEQSVKECK